jgi:NDP-sugar pyrophosphorylase family protein
LLNLDVIVLLNEETRKVEEEVVKGYKGKLSVSFYLSPEDSHTYAALAHLLNTAPAAQLEDNIVLVSSDIITSLQLKEPLQKYVERKLDFLLVCKSPEEKKALTKEKDKKEE